MGRVALGVVAAAFVVVTVVNTVDAARAGNPDAPGSRWVEGLTAKVRDAAARRATAWSRSGPIGGAGSAWIGAGIADALEHDGIETRVAPDLGFAYGARPRARRRARPAHRAAGRGRRARRGTRELPCFEDVGRVGKYTLFVKDPATCPPRP